MAHIVQFVDQIASVPAVRLDLNAGSYEVRREGVDLSPPNLRRVTIASMIRDGEEIPASAYDNRILRLTVEVTAANEDTLATNLQTLGRELDRRNNILMFQSHGAGNPVFFRTFRSPDYQRRRPNPQGLLVECDLMIVAEPFAYGLQETILNAVTVTNNPATNQYADTAATVKGDVPTPAYIETTGITASLKQLIAVRRHGTPGYIYEQAENMTNGTDAADVVDATCSAGNKVRVTPGTATEATRLTWNPFPRATPTSDDRGVYRVFARVSKTTGADVWQVRVRHTATGWIANIDNPLVTLLAASTQWHMVDLGLIQLPPGQDPIYDGYSNVQWAFEDTQLLLRAVRVSGGGNLDIDYIALIPASEELAIASANGTAATFLWDGPMDVVRPANGITTLCTFARAGAIPLLSPGQVNRIHVLRQLMATDAIADTVTLTVKYWPRWLAVSRPV